MTIYEKARSLLDAFMLVERTDGTQYWTLRDGHPYYKAAFELVFAVHDEGRILPDDYLYRYTVESLQILSENDGSDLDELEHEAIEVDESFADLTDWLKNAPMSIHWVDYMRGEAGPGRSILDDLSAGQWAQRRDVFHAVVRWLEQTLEEE